MRLLPLFPLPLVLFPGAPLPLHIFEPRYRHLMADCATGDREFGVIFRPEELSEGSLESGRVGCIARIDQAESLSDGRSNIIVHGVRRFALHRFAVTDRPYLVGEVSEYDDDETPMARREAIERLAVQVRALFERVGRAARTIADDGDPVPALPDDAALVAFAVAGYVDLPVEERQDLLASRSVPRRLEMVIETLSRALVPIEARAAVHVRAGSNGHGPVQDGGA